jgi:multiple sugar transport system substrate-binding protein
VFVRRVAVLLGAAGAALVLAAGAPARAATTTIVLSGWAVSAEEGSLLQNVVDAFEVAHPTIHVAYRPIDDYQSEMEQRFAAGDPPDVFYVDSSVAPRWIAQGFLQPLHGFATKSGFDTSHFFPVLRRAFEGPGGQPYGFPKDWSPLAMFTNDDLLARAGVAPPTTWEELRAAAEQIRAATGVTPICLSADWARLLAFVEQNGGSLLNDAQTAATIDSPAARAAVEFYVGLVRDGLAALPDALGAGWCGQAFADGSVAIAFEGNWLVPSLQSVDYSIHPLLSNVRRGNLAFTVAYSMAAASQHKQAAWELLSYLTGREGMQLWTSEGLALPSRDDVPVAPGREVFLGEAPVSTVWQFPIGFDDVLNNANAELASVFAQSESIDEMLASIEAAATAALAQPVP